MTILKIFFIFFVTSDCTCLMGKGTTNITQPQQNRIIRKKYL